MNREIAVQLAALTTPEVTAEAARVIIDTYLSNLGRCTVCDGTGAITFTRGTRIPVDQKRTGIHDDHVFVEEGATVPCPRCSSEQHDVANGGDPDFVQWHCYEGERVWECHNKRRIGTDGQHGGCGYRLVLELPSGLPGLPSGAVPETA